jgi:polyferredoxin
MSIISCPQCGKRTSSLAPICDHCGFQAGEAREEDLERYHQRRIRTRIYRLNMVTYAIMFAVVLAFGWYWLATDGFQSPLGSKGPYYMMGASALAYVVVRVFQFRARQQKKAVQRSDKLRG